MMLNQIKERRRKEKKSNPKKKKNLENILMGSIFDVGVLGISGCKRRAYPRRDLENDPVYPRCDTSSSAWVGGCGAVFISVGQRMWHWVRRHESKGRGAGFVDILVGLEMVGRGDWGRRGVTGRDGGEGILGKKKGFNFLFVLFFSFNVFINIFLLFK